MGRSDAVDLNSTVPPSFSPRAPLSSGVVVGGSSFAAQALQHHPLYPSQPPTPAFPSFPPFSSRPHNSTYTSPSVSSYSQLPPAPLTAPLPSFAAFPSLAPPDPSFAAFATNLVLPGAPLSPTSTNWGGAFGDLDVPSAPASRPTTAGDGISNEHPSTSWAGSSFSPEDFAAALDVTSLLPSGGQQQTAQPPPANPVANDPSPPSLDLSLSSFYAHPSTSHLHHRTASLPASSNGNFPSSTFPSFLSDLTAAPTFTSPPFSYSNNGPPFASTSTQPYGSPLLSGLVTNSPSAGEASSSDAADVSRSSSISTRGSKSNRRTSRVNAGARGRAARVSQAAAAGSSEEDGGFAGGGDESGDEASRSRSRSGTLGPSGRNSAKEFMTPEEYEEDKRRRNTEASARFRARKKVRDRALALTGSELREKVASLEKEKESLTTENRWLRSMASETDPGLLEMMERTFRDGGG